MKEAQTASELMMENQLPNKVDCVLPNEDVRRFLLEVIDQTNFPGKMSEFVVSVKHYLASAAIKHV